MIIRIKKFGLYFHSREDSIKDAKCELLDYYKIGEQSSMVREITQLILETNSKGESLQKAVSELKYLSN